MQSKEKFLTVDDHNVFCWKVAHPVQQVYIVASSTESTSRAYSYKYLEVLWLPKRTQLWACFHTEPNRLYRRLRSFPSKLQEYTPPPFSRLSTQYHIDPLLTFFLSILHERVCDYSRVQSSVTGILRMGDMNIHIQWRRWHRAISFNNQVHTTPHPVLQFLRICMGPMQCYPSLFLEHNRSQQWYQCII